MLSIQRSWRNEVPVGWLIAAVLMLSPGFGTPMPRSGDAGAEMDPSGWRHAGEAGAEMDPSGARFASEGGAEMDPSG